MDVLIYFSFGLNLLVLSIVLAAIKKLGYKFIYHRIRLMIYGTKGNYWLSRVSHYEALQRPMDSDTVFIGDSLTDGFLLHEYFEDNCLNRGINGESTKTLLKRLDRTITNPKEVYIMLGINDLNRNGTIEEIVSNYHEIIKIIKQKGSKINVFSVLPIDKNKKANRKVTNQVIDNLNEELKNMCNEENIAFLNINGHFKNEEGYLDSKYSHDGLHLTGLGYQKWVELIQLSVSDTVQ